MGSLHLEFSYLSDITGNNVYRNKVRKVREFLNKKKKNEGLYSNFINPKTGEWGKVCECYSKCITYVPIMCSPNTVFLFGKFQSRIDTTTVGIYGDSFYEYLLKSWIQNGKTEVEDRKMFDEAMEAVLTHLVRKSSSGLTYFGSLTDSVFDGKMDVLSCFIGTCTFYSYYVPEKKN